MRQSIFPPIEYSDEHGLLAIGGEISADMLTDAYMHGIFPWPLLDGTLAWFSPPRRTVLYLEDQKFHVSRTLKKKLRNHNLEVWLNKDFEQVIQACAETTRKSSSGGTWITEQIQHGYRELFLRGHAYSVSCYLKKELVGGFYGVTLHGFLSGESMFHSVNDASKIALTLFRNFLLEHDIPWIDCQMLTPMTKSFGAEELERDLFIALLKEQLAKESPITMRKVLRIS